MRCVACNKNLNDYESTRKDLQGNYIDMCNECYGTIKEDLLTTDRPDLLDNEEVSSEQNFSDWTDD
jgi:NAD-dependent SIR2 family protein deacetylase